MGARGVWDGSAEWCLGWTGAVLDLHQQALDGSVDCAECIHEEVKGKKADKGYICHKGKTIKINGNALKGHLGHGDTEGACSSG